MGDQNSNRVDYTTMKTFQILAILACVAGLNAGSIVGKPIVGKCPPVITTKPDFDYKQYAGIWYEIERVPVIFESGMSCVQATYNEISLVEDGLPQRHTKCERRLLAVDQVLLALQFFATGTFQSVVGNVLRVSQRSVGRSIHAVARALCRLGPKIMTIDKTNLVPVSYIVTYTLVHTNTSLNCSYKKILLKLPTCQECLDALTEPTSGSHVHMSGKLLMSIARDITQLTFKVFVMPNTSSLI